MDTKEIDATLRGTEFYLRVSGVRAADEPGWYVVAPADRPGVERQVNHLDIECIAPPRPLKAGDVVYRDKHAIPRTILFIHGDKALVKWAVTDSVELTPLAELSRTQRVLAISCVIDGQKT